jgi:4-hydroxybenzoate polyprenyltransferase
MIVGGSFLLVALICLGIQLLYSYRLKRWVIVDIFCVSSGFFLRVVAEALAIQVAISHWLIICSVMMSMFLALTKRRHELTFLGEREAGNRRKVLDKYSPHLLDQMISAITACTVLSYMLYCVSAETVEKFGTDHMIYTSPFVLFGIFRYLYLVHEKSGGGEPERVFFSDRALVLTLMLWAASSVAVVYGVI